MQKWCIGVDEVGRGPLAGPVAVGVVCVDRDFDWEALPGVTDSKKLTEKKREAIFAIAQRLKKQKQLDYAVCTVSATSIDTVGIISAINQAKLKALQKLSVSPNECLVKLDGGLSAPKEYVYQETIIKGDSKEKVIGLASIIAKVTRDRYMVRIAKQAEYVPYTFAQHKGYGTQKHREAITKHGLSSLHRKSFCRNLIK